VFVSDLEDGDYAKLAADGDVFYEGFSDMIRDCQNLDLE